MPKERRRSLREAAFSRVSPICDGSWRGGVGREGNFSSTEICDDQTHMAEQCSGPAGSDVNPARECLVPQVTITSDGDSRVITQEDLEEEVNGRLRRKLSNSSLSSNGSSTAFEESEDDILSDNETKSKGIVTLEHLGDSVRELNNTRWKLKTIVHCHLLASNPKRLSWVQLAGHEGSFKAADEGSILKKFSENEKLCFEWLKDDALNSFVPSYYGVVERDGELFLKMKDLLAGLESPNVMDCKMGMRTYLEEELVLARVKPKLRADLYKKMLEVDSSAPTEEEMKQQAITKPRYMQWRESVSSTNTLGFRIEGIKRGENCSTDFKRTRSKEDVTKIFRDFFGGNKNIINSYITRLEDIKQALKKSEFFKKHEVIGSSLLFIHNQKGRAEVWVIDFGKTTPLLDGQTLDHHRPWTEGNREDGYLWGLDNLLQILASLARE
ncbi:inositol-trisphosphate 3-kinase A [Triplophysa rosa]|uniref:Kinase n=1 Tax=Triplophysa rosa TaxID=992332 RepID=A0A9W7TXV5_TRIRA|nr:inositol-trisphosphate 3-kinase A [Triplophysa rosa]KAI7804609.1 putative inositol-trisphosphate 3-kinase A [Triplophysa rosa]